MDTAKDMWKVYSKTSTQDLIKNLHRKEYELQKLVGQHGYWARKEKLRLARMIMQIGAVIRSRSEQEPLF